LSAKYFVDISEAVAKGITLIKLPFSRLLTAEPRFTASSVGSGQSYYYVNIDFTGINIFPGGINEYKRDVYSLLRRRMERVTGTIPTTSPSRDLTGLYKQKD